MNVWEASGRAKRHEIAKLRTSSIGKQRQRTLGSRFTGLNARARFLAATIKVRTWLAGNLISGKRKG